MTTNKALTQSITAKLSQLARTQDKPYDQLLTIFLLERAVARLVADSTLARCLIFKGGYVSVRVYDSPRFTTDIDAVLHGLDQTSAVEKIREQMALPFGDGAWFRYEKEQNLVTQSEYGGWRLVFRGGLGDPPEKLHRAQIIDIDIGTGDPVAPAPRLVETESLVGSSSLSWQVYPIETILAEKLHTLVARGSANSRARDVYDIGLLLPRADSETLRTALQATFTYRGDLLPKVIADVLRSMDTALLEKGWHSATSHISGVGRFNAIWHELVVNLRHKGF
ncbi:MAG: nucleotidyl transferase AbiEii/AbiGii toxin family protein [Deltaproteobacteria bacterium]|nr:nucleotidyl transferase AbiEii/AbiGii toxin family protein [Deltaproteobacteria bacterium]